MLRACEFQTRLTSDQIFNKQNVCSHSSRRWTASIFPSLDTLLSIFCNNLLVWSTFCAEILVAVVESGCCVSPGGATMCYKVHNNIVNRCTRDKQRWTMPETTRTYSGVLRTWAIKDNSSVLGPPYSKIETTGYSRRSNTTASVAIIHNTSACDLHNRSNDVRVSRTGLRKHQACIANNPFIVLLVHAYMTSFRMCLPKYVYEVL